MIALAILRKLNAYENYIRSNPFYIGLIEVRELQFAKLCPYFKNKIWNRISSS